MFTSTKISESPRSQKVGSLIDKPSNSMKDTSGIYRSFTAPKLTSTPVRLNIYGTPPKPHILSQRR